MEIGDDPTAVDVNGLDPQLARIMGMTDSALGDDSARMADKVLTLTVVLLKEQLDKFGVRYPKSGPNSLKPNLQAILTDHLKENEVFFAYEGGGGKGFLGDRMFVSFTFARGNSTRLSLCLPQGLLSE